MSIRRIWGYIRVQTQYFIFTVLKLGHTLRIIAENSKVTVRQIGVKNCLLNSPAHEFFMQSEERTGEESEDELPSESAFFSLL